MEKISSKRVTICVLVLLSFVGACLSQFTASAQRRVGEEGQTQDRASGAEAIPQQNAKKGQGKGDKGKITPKICNDCDPGGGGGGGGGGYTGDGHIWCDGWDRQGDCAFNHVNAAVSVEFRRQKGNNGYDWQTFLTWFPEEIDGFGRFPLPDGNVGMVSTSPLPGQIPLYRWSTRKGFYYSVYYTEHSGDDYVYGGVAGYVWPAGDSRGFPLYQFYSQEYGHFYTNYPRNEISCRPRVYWDFQGEMARVNWPAPASQALQTCSTLGPFPGSCDPFFAERCRQAGGFFDFNSCSCF